MTAFPDGGPPAGGREVLAIIGTGLMGGSLGLASLASGSVHRVIGADLQAVSLGRALERRAITEAAASPEEAVAGATIVVLSMPVGAIPAAYRRIAPHLRPGTVVTDLGSTKARLVEEITPLVPPGTHFIGGHPLAGAETEGIDSADPALFRGAFWILTPTGDTDPGGYGRLVRFLGTLGVHVVSLNPSRHDELVALTSHLPQLLSSTLMGFAADISSSEGGLPLIAAGGFRDMTRIAASSPDLWLDIIRANKGAVLAVLRRFQAALAAVASSIEEADWESLRARLAGAREGRDRLAERPGLVPKALMSLLVPVPDQPGVLAQVATTVGEAGVNIEDFMLVPSPEGLGAIHLSVSGEDAARRAREALERVGYAPLVVPGTVLGG